MKNLLISTFILILVSGCNKPLNNKDIAIFRLSIDNSIGLSSSKLRTIIDKLKEVACFDTERFEPYKMKVLKVDKMCSQFYMLADSIINQKEVSEIQIIELRKAYQTTLDSLASFIKSNNKMAKLQGIEHNYDLENNSSDFYTVFGLIMKSDLIKNEISVLEDFYNLYLGCNWPSPNFAYCEPKFEKKSDYSFSVVLVEEKLPNATRKIEVDSITLNGNRVPLNNIIVQNNSNHSISLNSLRNGKYVLNGALIIDYPCYGRTQSYPFSHKFLIENRH